MKAIWYERTGAARDVLEFGSIAPPRPADGEVAVRVATSGVNPSDTKRRAGWLDLQMPHPRIIPHSDGGGTIEAVGSGVDPARIGQRVWLWNAQGAERAFGTAAERVAVPTRLAVELPEGVGFATAAGLGVPGCTAHYAVFGDGPVGDRTILVQGAAGSVGQLAVQLATLGGARVIATVSSAKKAALALADGAVEALDYTEGGIVERVMELTAGAGVDRIVEVDLAANLETDLQILRANGVIASYSSTSNPTPRLPYYPLAFRDARIHFVQGYLLPSAARRAAIRDLSTWLAAGQLDVRIGASFPLARTVEAHEAVEGGNVIGKVVVEIDREPGHSPTEAR